MFPSRSILSIQGPRTSHNSFSLFALLTALVLSFSLSSLSLSPVSANPVAPGNHTSPTLDTSCTHVAFSPDGNPFPLCPGPFPLTGGNCTWWAWEQWHLLGYDLPVNWGNAADWLVGAERSGFSIGPLPRLGSIAVFPRADGVWAYGPAGHVAFVSNVYPDGQTFDVTYQNYGDPTPMYQGKAYNVSLINQAAFQDGTMNFIYFPQPINLQRFTLLPGISSFDPLALAHANSTLNALSSDTTHTSDRLALGLAPGSSDQEFNADFTGSGLSNLLLYNRQAGQLIVLRLDVHRAPGLTLRYASRESFHEDPPVPEDSFPQMVQLGDSQTPTGTWGPNLEVHIGRFAGTSASDILLYDRSKGTIQLLSLNSDLSISHHVTLPGYGLGWELYVGQFNPDRSSVLLYNRFAAPIYTPISNPWSTSSPLPVSTTVPVPTASVHPHPTPKPAATTKATPTSTPKPTVTPKATATPAAPPRVTATPAATPRVTPTPHPTPLSTPTVAPTPTPHGGKTPTPTMTSPSALSPHVASLTHTLSFAHPHSLFSSAQSLSSHNTTASTPLPTSIDNLQDLSGTDLSDWEKLGRSANIYLLDFNSDFSIHTQQAYSLWHSNWEVYIGRFSSSTQDGVFLYDRLMGEGRLLDFDSHLLVHDYQSLHHLDGNWVVYTGDFMGSGRSQLLLYDPSSGSARAFLFSPDLSLAGQKSYSNWGTNQILYVGHFGTPSLAVMLYDSQHAESTFITFDHSLTLSQRYTVRSWDQNWQILIGSFLDRSRCLSHTSCSTNDDILVLNRKTGQLEQYLFSFGRTFKLYDNRLQSFERIGLTSDTHLASVDTSSFSFVSVLQTNIKNEELY